jgi:flagellar hook-associated protein 3 FlgL
MTRITTAAENALVLFYTQQNQSQLADLNAQISTGLTAQTYDQIAPQANHLVDFRAEASRQQDFISTIDTINTRLQITDQSLSQIQDVVQKFRSLLPGGAFNTTSPDIKTQAQLALQQIAGFLNTQDGTRYLFGGTDSQTPPVDISNLPTGAAATLTTPVNGPPASNGYYAGGPAVPPVRIDTQVTLNYAVKADDPATFEPIIRVLNFLAQNAPFNPTNATDQANVTQAGQILDQALQALTTTRGTLGLQQSQLNAARTVHQNTINIAQNGVSNIVAVDQATAITKLQTLETQLQASFTATSQIEKLSLVNFING